MWKPNVTLECLDCLEFNTIKPFRLKITNILGESAGPIILHRTEYPTHNRYIATRSDGEIYELDGDGHITRYIGYPGRGRESI